MLNASEQTLRRIGEGVAAGSHDATLYGQAEIEAACVVNQSLALRRDAIPLTLHVDIIGWPSGDDAKSRQKLIAEKLVDCARLLRY